MNEDLNVKNIESPLGIEKNEYLLFEDYDYLGNMEDLFHMYYKPELDFYNIKRPVKQNSNSKPRLAQMRTVSEESSSTL